MSTPSSPQLKRAALAAAVVCSALSLSACGGDSVTHRPPPPPTGNTPPPVANDSFFAYVLARVGSLLENDEPADIDAVMETKPEDTEPATLGP